VGDRLPESIIGELISLSEALQQSHSGSRAGSWLDSFVAVDAALAREAVDEARAWIERLCPQNEEG
jgi:hypothetical protein